VCVCVWAGRETIQKQRFAAATEGVGRDPGWECRFAYTENKLIYFTFINFECIIYKHITIFTKVFSSVKNCKI